MNEVKTDKKKKAPKAKAKKGTGFSSKVTRSTRSAASTDPVEEAKSDLNEDEDDGDESDGDEDESDGDEDETQDPFIFA